LRRKISRTNERLPGSVVERPHLEAAHQFDQRFRALRGIAPPPLAAQSTIPLCGTFSYRTGIA
jgi:hypothetical protein